MSRPCLKTLRNDCGDQPGSSIAATHDLGLLGGLALGDLRLLGIGLAVRLRERDHAQDDAAQQVRQAVVCRVSQALGETRRTVPELLARLAVVGRVLALVQLGERRADVVEVLLEQGPARRHAEGVDEVAKLDARAQQAVALLDELCSPSVSALADSDALLALRATNFSSGIDLPAMRCMRSGTWAMILPTLLGSWPASYIIAALA